MRDGKGGAAVRGFVNRGARRAAPEGRANPDFSERAARWARRRSSKPGSAVATVSVLPSVERSHGNRVPFFPKCAASNVVVANGFPS